MSISRILLFLIVLLSNLGCQSQEKPLPETTAHESDDRFGIPLPSVDEAKNSDQLNDYAHASDSSTIRLKFTNGLRAILEDSRGNLWFGSHNEGLARLHDGRLTYYTTENGLSDNQVRSIYEAEDGTVWFECGRGLSVFAEKKLTVAVQRNYSQRNRWDADPHDLWFKGDEHIGYAKTQKNMAGSGQFQIDLNVSEESPGVYRYTDGELRYLVFPMLTGLGNENAYSISTPFARGRNNRVWFGMYSAVIGYDGKNFTTFTDDSLNLNKSTGYLHVRSLYEDSRGLLWIGNNGIGVLRYDGQKMTNFSRERNLVSLDSQNRGGFRSPKGTLEHIFAIGEDRNGNIWFGDRDTGAWRYDGKTVKNYTQKDGLPVPHIWQIYNAKNGELWFAMGDGSVQRFVNEHFERIF